MRSLMSLFFIFMVAFALPQPRVNQEHTMKIDTLWDGVVRVDPPAFDANSLPGAVTDAQRLEEALQPRTFSFQPRSRAQSILHTTTAYSPPVTQKCNILVKGSNTTYGYIAPRFNDFGEYGPLQTTQDEALLVSFSHSTDSPSQIDLAVTNGPTATYPFMGGVVGYMSDSDDLSLGSSSYAYIAGINQTLIGYSPVAGDNSLSAASSMSAHSESAIWMYDPATSIITAQWTNRDTSAPKTKIIYADNDNNDALLITGDPEAFRYTFSGSYSEVVFVCVPPIERSLSRFANVLSYIHPNLALKYLEAAFKFKTTFVPERHITYFCSSVLSWI